MKTSSKSGARTLLMSVVMSSPGPIVVGIGLFLGKSSTQLADFIRRTAELSAILVSYLVYKSKNREKLGNLPNNFVGAALCISGLAMIIIALMGGSSADGNVIPGLAIAVLGVTTNSWFWLRYRKLNQEKPDDILSAQSKLYRAKSLVDACVCAALLTIVLAPGTMAAKWMDIGGSIVVALYLVVNGLITLFVPEKNLPDQPQG